MRLGSDDGAFLDLMVAGYEFPNVPRSSDPWDANWLNIRGWVRLADGRQWKFIHPCLTTFEARRLASWLARLGENVTAPTSGDARSRLDFTELLLAFEAVPTPGGLSVRVVLGFDALPPWRQEDQRTDLDEYIVSIPIDSRQLAAAIDQWERDLAPFPER
ncbi:hypothetical protein E6C70_11195 [Glaciibacter flavus]|uniref:Uncharacterized protein n=1 Tax=Orlajensenia flava TaxID=2565934 RepID=A0A4S4FVD5_9MICO|nr:hypothetical protein [Glaciibacter flavus]THG33982.1 hypothetical protein E6C70_11195 [Glaciibacter flavus]